MGAEDEEAKEKPKLEVSVTDPVSFSSPYLLCHTSFCIRITTNHSAFSLSNSEVRRRFSEFKWLRNILERHHPARDAPPLPSGGLLVWNKFTPEFLERRRNDLEVFINRIISVPVYLGEKALHLFLQTELSTKDIERNLLGKRDDQIVPIKPTVSSSSPFDIDSNKVCDATCGEEHPVFSLDDGYGSSENHHRTLYHESTEVEEKLVDGSPWYISSSSEALE